MMVNAYKAGFQYGGCVILKFGEKKFVV